MAATTLRQTEAEPEAYPAAPISLSAAASDLPAALIWQRLEAYVAFRWALRDVEWIVEGPGAWRPPLAPAAINAVEIWSSADEWESVTLSPSPLGGYYLPATGPYRFTGTTGSTDPDVSAIVAEAFGRLAEYMAAKPSTAGKAGARSETLTVGNITLSSSRSPSWMAQAMENSGAGDLLRSLRRV